MSSISWSPDGSQLMTGGWDSSVREFHTDAELAFEPLQPRQVPASLRVHALAHSPNSSLLAIASGQVIFVVDAQGPAAGTSEPLEGHSDDVTCLQWSPAGDWLASGSLDTNVMLWPGGGPVGSVTLGQHTTGVRALAFAPGANLTTALATADSSGHIFLWRLDSDPSVLAPAGLLLVDSWPVQALAWSPSLLAAAAEDSLEEIKDEVTGVRLRSSRSSIRTWAIDRERLGEADSQPAAVKLARDTASEITTLAFSADGRFLARGGSDRRVVIFEADPSADVTNGDAPFIPSMVFRSDKDGTEMVTSLAWMPSAVLPQLAMGTISGNLYVWAAGTDPRHWSVRRSSHLPLLRQEPVSLEMLYDVGVSLDGKHPGEAHSCQWSPDGNMLAMALASGQTAFWVPKHGHLELPTTSSNVTHSGGATAVDWAPPGGAWKLATGGVDAVVRLWPVDGTEPSAVVVLGGFSDRVTSVSWHPLGATLAAGSNDHSLKIWAAGVSGQLANGNPQVSMPSAAAGVTALLSVHLIICMMLAPIPIRLSILC